jgi:hypothetical protein
VAGAILCGDFNSAPGSGMYRFLQYGSLDLPSVDRRSLSGGSGCIVCFALFACCLFAARVVLG